MAPGPPAELDRAAVGFVAALRLAGLPVRLASSIAFVEALGVLGIARRDDVFWAGRSTLVHRPEDAALFDRVFDAYWHRAGFLAEGAADVETITLAIDDEQDDDGADGDEDEPSGDVLTVRFSATEVLRHMDFAAYTDAELAEARVLMDRLRLVGAPKRSRRLVPTRRSSGAPDLRRTVRLALRAGGEPVRRAHRTPGERPRRIVLLLDVSGSMESYARALLRFVHAAVVGRTTVEAFAVGTRLTRLTRELSSRDPDAALARAAEAVADWSGGTRLGEGIGAFVDEWGQRGMARGAIVVVLSDGWDRGDPTVMAEQMGRLHRIAHKVVWVNPLKASPGYQPLAQGMAAALPYIDDFVEGHSIDSLERLAEVIGR